METDATKLQKLTQLSDKEFAQLIKEALISAGCSENQARSAANAAPMIKNKLKNASERDIEKIVSFIGRKNADDILSKVKDDSKK